MARLALGCVDGDEAFALAQLAPLADAKRWRDCADAMRDLAMPDAHACTWSAAVRALAERVGPTPQRAAAEALMATLGDGDPTRIAAAFAAPRVEPVVACSNCSDATHDSHTFATGAVQLLPSRSSSAPDVSATTTAAAPTSGCSPASALPRPASDAVVQ